MKKCIYSSIKVALTLCLLLPQPGAFAQDSLDKILEKHGITREEYERRKAERKTPAEIAAESTEEITADLISFSLPPKAAMSLLYGKEKTAGDAEMFQKCMDLALRKRIKIVARSRARSAGGSRAVSKVVRDYSYPDNYSEEGEDRDQLVPKFTTRETGTIFQFAATRSPVTNEVETSYSFENNFAEPTTRNAALKWEKRRKEVKYPHLLTDFYVEKLNGHVRFERPEPRLIGITFPPKSGSSIPSSGSAIHLTFLKPQFEELPIVPPKIVPPRLAPTYSRRSMRIEYVVVEVPADAPIAKNPSLSAADFSASIAAIETGKVKLVTAAGFTANNVRCTPGIAMRETALVKRISQVGDRTLPNLSFEHHWLGTLCNMKPFNLDPKSTSVDMGIILDYQFHEPVQTPFTFGKSIAEDAVVLKGEIEFNTGTVKVLKRIQMESGVPIHVETIDPVEATGAEPGAKDVRHIVFAIWTIFDPVKE